MRQIRTSGSRSGRGKREPVAAGGVTTAGITPPTSETASPRHLSTLLFPPFLSSLFFPFPARIARVKDVIAIPTLRSPCTAWHNGIMLQEDEIGKINVRCPLFFLSPFLSFSLS